MELKMAETTFSDLRKPFPTKDLNWKTGIKIENGLKGQAVPHLDARAVQNRLDDIMGPSNWKNKFIEVFNGPTLFSVRCVLSLKIDGEWVDKEDAATISSNSDNFIDRNALTKGVYSDALKRAAVQWGIGRYLYDYDCEYVDLDDHGKLCFIPKLPKALVLAEEHAEYFKPDEKVASEPTVPQAAPSAKEIVATRANAQPAAMPAEVLKQPADDIPVDVTDAERALIKELLLKLEKNPPNVIKTYVQGPKGVQKLGESARAYVVKKADEKEKQLA